MLTPKGRLSWQEALKFINKCPVCGSNYKTEQAKVFAENNTANLVHINCIECNGNFIALIITLNQAISTVGMMSDLTLNDARTIGYYEPIGVDELIEGRLWINQSNIKFLDK